MVGRGIVKWAFMVLGVVVICSIAYALAINGYDLDGYDEDAVKRIREDGPAKWTYNDRLRGTVPKAIFKGPVWEGLDTKKSKNPGGYEISYKLNYPGYVRIRITGPNSKHCILKELISWEYRKPGTYTAYWDGKDASGYVVGDSYGKTYNWEPEGVQISDREAELVLNHPQHVFGHLHRLHKKEECGILQIDMIWPNKGETVSGIARVHGLVGGDFMGRGKTWGFGAHLYVDYKQVADVDFDYSESPHIYIDLDTTKLTNGDHLLTMVICDHNDHAGTVSVMVKVQN